MDSSAGRTMPGMTNNTRPRDFPSAIALNPPESERPSHSALPQGFGNASGWGGSIWNSNSIGTALGSTALRDSARPRGIIPTQGMSHVHTTHSAADNGGVYTSASTDPIEGKTGSGSLVASSESDPWNMHRSPWGDSSNAAGIPHVRSSGVSPARKRSIVQPQPAQQFNDNSSSSYFASSRTANLGQGAVAKLAKPRLDPTTMNFTSTRQVDQLSNGFASFAFGQSEMASQRPEAPPGPWSDAASVHSPNDDRRSITASEYFGSSSATQSRSGSLPPSRHGEPAQYPPTNDHFSRYPQANPRQHSSFSHPNGRALQDRNGSIQSDSLQMLSRLSLDQDAEPPMLSHRPSVSISGLPPPFTPSGADASFSRETYTDAQNLARTDDSNFGNSGAYTPDHFAHGHQSDPNIQFRAFQFDTRSAPNGTAVRQSPFYSHAHTPPVYDHLYPSRSDQALSNGNNMALVTSKLQGYQQQQERRAYINPGHIQAHPLQQMYTASSLRHPYSYPNFVPNGMHMNGLAQSVPIQVVPQVPQMVMVEAPRAPREHNQQAEGIMGKTLWDFKQNKTTNKRYELKDIFGDIVEFSGDQHGSRFIQQKIETANSDEKDRVFKELQGNALQLMQDVFGNYVIQKFFEHGDQTQKKILAARMKGHVLQLSKQMYGCRVVQKALEHILTDQQAELVKELDRPGAVLECVKDQNGNHVIQKAVERVPAEHIQFIVEAFKGNVGNLALNSYGCRVIQRMLEYCEEPAKRFIMQELHAEGGKLIADSYGNYVTQHIIEHGTLDDRAKIMELVKADLFSFSKHKHASNVVEKSLMRASDQERREIMLKLVEKNERGESHVPVLIKDNYGNYVIQRVLDLLNHKDYDEMVSILKPEVEKVKKIMSGKQLIAIEKKMHRFDRVDSVSSPQRSSMSSATDSSDVPPLTTDAQSPQSSSLPSGNTSTIDDPVHTTPTANKALPSPGLMIENAS